MSADSYPCPIRGCEGHRGATELLCRTHWFRVPRATRNRVWREYRREPGSPEHREACAEAIKAAQEPRRR